MNSKRGVHFGSGLNYGSSVISSSKKTVRYLQRRCHSAWISIDRRARTTRRFLSRPMQPNSRSARIVCVLVRLSELDGIHFQRAFVPLASGVESKMFVSWTVGGARGGGYWMAAVLRSYRCGKMVLVIVSRLVCYSLVVRAYIV